MSDERQYTLDEIAAYMRERDPIASAVWDAMSPFVEQIAPGITPAEPAATGRKYELTDETRDFYGVTLYRIRCVTAFEDVDGDEVEEGTLGGWIAAEKNLDQSGNAWVSGNALVHGNALVSGEITTGSHS